jgi:hypothetical protein
MKILSVCLLLYSFFSLFTLTRSLIVLELPETVENSRVNTKSYSPEMFHNRHFGFSMAILHQTVSVSTESFIYTIFCFSTVIIGVNNACFILSCTRYMVVYSSLGKLFLQKVSFLNFSFI